MLTEKWVLDPMLACKLQKTGDSCSRHESGCTQFWQQAKQPFLTSDRNIYVPDLCRVAFLCSVQELHFPKKSFKIHMDCRFTWDTVSVDGTARRQLSYLLHNFLVISQLAFIHIWGS